MTFSLDCARTLRSVCLLARESSKHLSIHEYGWYWRRTPRSFGPLASESLTIHPRTWMGTVPFSGAYSTRRPKSSLTKGALSVDWDWALRTEAGRIVTRRPKSSSTKGALSVDWEWKPRPAFVRARERSRTEWRACGWRSGLGTCGWPALAGAFVAVPFVASRASGHNASLICFSDFCSTHHRGKSRVFLAIENCSLFSSLDLRLAIFYIII